MQKVQSYLGNFINLQVIKYKLKYKSNQVGEEMQCKRGNSQPEFIKQKIDQYVKEGQSFEEEQENICLKQDSLETLQNKISTNNEGIFSRNNFISPQIIIFGVLLFFAIFSCLRCVFQQGPMKEKEEIQVRKIIDFSNNFNNQLTNTIYSGENVIKQQVEKLSGTIQILESKVSRLKKQLKQQKIKQVKLIESQSKQNKSKSQKPKYRIRQPPRINSSNTSSTDLYQFPKPINQIIHFSSMKVIYLHKNISQGIQQSTFQRAIRLMQVTHNINSKGDFVMDHFRFYFSAKQKYEALSELVDEQNNYYDKKYEISKYRHEQIGMCVVVNSYNNAEKRLYFRNLDSIFQQNYRNYHLVYVDDASTDKTIQQVTQYMVNNQIPKSKYIIVNNNKRSGFAANAYMAAQDYCQLGEIMILMDGGDSFIGRQVLSLLNAVYQKQKIALTYGSFLEVQNFKVTKGYSQQIKAQHLQNGQIRQSHVSLVSPLRTMYVDIIRLIKDKNLQYENRTFYDIGSDLALMASALQLIGTRVKFLPELIYEHRLETQQVMDIEKLRQVQNEVWKKQCSKRLVSMSFAEYPMTVYYP